MLETFQQQKQQQEQVNEEKLQYVEFLKQKSEQYQTQINKMKVEKLDSYLFLHHYNK